MPKARLGRQSASQVVLILILVPALAASGAACNRESAPRLGPSPVLLTVTVSGTVSERAEDGIQPVAGATVEWCDVRGCGQGTSVLTDEAGRFSITAIQARTQVYVQAKKTGYYEGKSATFLVSGAGTADIVIRSKTAPTVLKGVVQGMTASGPQPIGGAVITACDSYARLCDGLITAETGPDGAFRITLGNWEGWMDLQVAKPGWQTGYGELFVAGVTQFNVTLSPSGAGGER